MTAAVILVWFICTIGDSIGAAFQIGPDEHHEVMKAFLVSNGYTLYNQIWNDQPPLHTLLLAILFRFFGPTIIVARILAALFALLLLVGFFLLVKKRHGYCAAAVATFCLLSGPQVLNLSVSAMLEVPAWAIGLWSLWPLQQCDKYLRWTRILASAILFAIALQIKLTAGLLAPAICAEIIMIALTIGSRRSFIALSYALVWIACVSVIFIVLGLCCGSGYEQAWASHFSSHARRSIETQHYVFSIDVLLDHPEGLFGTAIGLAAFPLLNQRRNLLFPSVLLVTLALVHFFHRPWWPYYYLHFAITLAWLSGCAFVAVQRLGTALFANSPAHRFSFNYRGVIMSTGLLILFAICGIQRLHSEIESIRNQPKIQSNNLVAKMKAAAAQTKWAYTPATMYAFHAGILVPPELGVVVKKRYWCGQISEKDISNVVRRYQPEQLLLPLGTEHSENYSFIHVKYNLICEGDGYALYFQRGMFTNTASILPQEHGPNR